MLRRADALKSTGKLDPNWEGPYVVTEVLKGGAYELKDMEASRRALVAWEKVMLPLQAGGLNIINLKFWNRAAICKLFWGLHQKKDRIWIRWIHGYYIKQQDIYEMSVPMQCSWIIRKIPELGST